MKTNFIWVLSALFSILVSCKEKPQPLPVIEAPVVVKDTVEPTPIVEEEIVEEIKPVRNEIQN